MERLTERLIIAEKALATLKELAGIKVPSAIERDACIQRFEYSFEAVWKVAKRYLNVLEGVDAASPKSVIRSSMDVGLLDESVARNALLMVDDRNLTSHTYNVDLANEIFSRIPVHVEALDIWLASMKVRINALG